MQIACKNLSIGYGSRPLLRGLSFQVEDGDYFCITGENGSGKTTLFKTLLGLQPALEGEIVFPRDRKNALGYLPQQRDYQRDFPASVEEIVRSGNLASMGFRPFYHKKERDKTWEMMEKLAILPLAKRPYRSLSGGQQQRVLLARALCASSKLLFLDEPVAGLDEKVSRDFYQILEGLNQKGTSILMISHDLAAVEKYAKHILQLLPQERGENTYTLRSPKRSADSRQPTDSIQAPTGPNHH